jgi:hypothetical protein
MASKEFGVDIDLSLNQLVNSRAQNGTSFISGGVSSSGRFMFDTVSKRLQYDDGFAIKDVANLNDVAGLLDFKGGYNASTNFPNLTSGVGILKGDYYVVTVPGTFYGQNVEVGDSLFANFDAPVTLAGWTIVQGNTVPASETVAGIIAIATQVEVDAGTNDTKAVTPLKLKNSSYITRKYVSPATSVGSGTATTFTHNLGTTNVQVQAKRVSTGALVTLSVNNFTLNTVDITKNGASYNIIAIIQG